MRTILILAAVMVMAAPARAQPTVAGDATLSAAQKDAASRPILKRKIAVGRFTNSTRYGKALLFDGERAEWILGAPGVA